MRASDRLRVLVLHSRYLSGPASGENRVVDDEARLLADAGHDVRLWDPSPDEASGVGLVRTAAGAVWSKAAVGRVRELVDDHRPDVVHIHNLFPALSPAVVRAAGASGAAVVMTLHNYRLLCIGAVLLRDGKVCTDCVARSPLPGVMHGCYRGSRAGSAAVGGSIGLHRALGTFDRVDRFLAISGFVAEMHVRGGLPAASIRVKPHFAWPSVRRVGAGGYFLFLGRLSREKGAETIVRAWRPELGTLMVAGDGPDGDHLRGLAPAGVRFLGTVPSQDVPALVSKARAVLVPSICYEGAGRVVLEACAAGVPVLASRIGGLAEAVEDERSGLLLPPGDGQAWMRGVERLLDDRVSRGFGHRAFELWQERSSPEGGLRALEEAYAEAVEHARGRDRVANRPPHVGVAG